VIAPDAPGHGFSEKPRGAAYDLATYTSSVVGLLEALGIKRAPLVAISGGGAVALQLALTHAERVSRLVLVDAAGLGREVAWTYRVTTLPFVRQLFRRSLDPRSVEAFGRSLCYRRDRLPDGWVDRRLAIWSTEGAVEAFFATVGASLTLYGQKVDFSRRLHQVRQPTLIIWGRQDPILPLAHGVRAGQRMPQARLQVFEQCGHMPMWEYPDEFVRAVLDFVT
jgi:4,5:9,10-diseco-3-hydroxy-5,9,17-trioxoandrosta-1(10),2-diene-4-oate hydrolase